MKKILLAVTFITFGFTHQIFAQDKPPSSPLSPILDSYYGVKDALTADNGTDAATRSGELLKTINGVDMKSLPAKDHAIFMSLQTKLAFDARHISESKDINHQREHFAALSTNMFALAKGAKLSATPIYKEYCPMKKASWLSKEEEIKNPYYGSSMLTCGKVTETVKQ
ncbi:DUF3347 domain-containing protein [Flavitalea flava]